MGSSPTPEANSGSRLLVRESYPSFTDPDTWALAITGIYLALFVIGMCGNAATLTLIHNYAGLRALFCARKLNASSVAPNDAANDSEHNINNDIVMARRKVTVASELLQPPLPASHSDYMFMFLLALCVVDMTILMSLPSAMVDSFIGVWIFGSAFCKLHQLCSTIGRLTSAFLISAMTMSYCIRVRRRLRTARADEEQGSNLSFGDALTPQRPQRRQIPTGRRSCSLLLTLATCASLIVISLFFLIPFLMYVQPQKIFLFNTVRDGVVNNVSITVVIQYRIFKCVDVMPRNLLLWFTASTFLVGYLLTLLIFTGSVCGLIETLRNSSTSWSCAEEKSLRRVSAYIVMIGVLYYICWAPYWASVIYVAYFDLIMDSTSIKALSAQHTLLFIYLPHVFYYVNAAINWVFYARMISHLRPPNMTASEKFSTSQVPPFFSETLYVQRRLTRRNRSSSEINLYARPLVVSNSDNDAGGDDEDSGAFVDDECAERSRRHGSALFTSLPAVRASRSADSINYMARHSRYSCN